MNNPNPNPYANKAVERALQESSDSLLIAGVPIDGLSGPRVDLYMSHQARDHLATAINVHGLEQSRESSSIDEVIRAGLSYHERQGWIPGAEQRARYIRDNVDLLNHLASTTEESVEHAHDVIYDMQDFDLDLFLAHLRLWALCSGTNAIYQIGVINIIVAAESSVQLFNSIPGAEPTHTIFFIRTCVWDEGEGMYTQSWSPMVASRPFDSTVQLQQATGVIDDTQSGGVFGPNTGSHIAVASQQPPVNLAGTLASAPQPTPSVGPAYRKARLHMRPHPHHTPATSYLDRTPEQILAPGSGVETDEMYGGLVLYLGLAYPNHILRNLISMKREGEENQRPWATASNQILHRIRDALQHIFGAERYNEMLDLFTAARGDSGAADMKAWWFQILSNANTYDVWSPERCPKCSKSAPHVGGETEGK